jgi:NADH dehydrogenase (ubiquinone) 1 alpha subcomplex subunit 9
MSTLPRLSCEPRYLTYILGIKTTKLTPPSRSIIQALGEKAVLEEFPNATIVRPATMYGDEDRFWNRFGFFSVSTGAIPLAKGGLQRIRPVYVGDVAAILSALQKDERGMGKVIELYGPKEYYFGKLVKLFLEMTKRNINVLPAPKVLYKLVAGVYDRITALPMITPDEVERVSLFISFFDRS